MKRFERESIEIQNFARNISLKGWEEDWYEKWI
jgi:hypothetical protein